MAGLTLGGRIGHLSRPYGLTIDNLLAVDVVLADGRFVTADAEEHTDLYWAVRGGGGNFGVVTSFLFRLHPVKMVSTGRTFWPLDQAPQVMKAYREFITQAPEEVSGFFAFLTVPPVSLVPSEPASPEDVRDHLVFDGGAREGGSGHQSHVQRRLTGARSRRADVVPRSPKPFRWPLPARIAVVMAGRLLQRDQRCVHRAAPQVRRAASHRTFHHAHVSDQRRRSTRRQYRHGV